MAGAARVAGGMLAGMLVLAGCGYGPVLVDPHEVDQASQGICARLIEVLPASVSDAVQRSIDPPSASVAAWGAPPIVLRCGVDLPPAYRPDADLLVVDGIGWLPVDGAGGSFYVATDRRPLIEVAIPDEYQPEAVLVDLASAIQSVIPESSG